MKFQFLIAVLSVVTGVSTSFAQDVPPPRKPVLPKAPAFASWTIEFKYKADENNKDTPATRPPDSVTPDRAQKITVTKTNKTYRELLVFKSGKTQEKWIYEGIELMKSSDTNAIVPVSEPTPDSPNPDYADYKRSDFKRLEWVSLDCYKGVKSYQDKPAYSFESTGPEGKKLIAYLAINTQLPLLCSDYEQTRFYTYNPPPTMPLVLPPDFLAVITRYKNAVEGLKYHPSPP